MRIWARTVAIVAVAALIIAVVGQRGWVTAQQQGGNSFGSEACGPGETCGMFRVNGATGQVSACRASLDDLTKAPTCSPWSKQ